LACMQPQLPSAPQQQVPRVGDPDADDDDNVECVICRAVLEDSAALMVFECGHFFCEDCTSTVLRAQRPNCPMCRRDVNVNQVFRAVATRASAAAAGRHNPELDPPEGRGVVHVKVLGSWMTKIDALLRRLLLLREQAPDEKSLVFSQFPDALKLVGRALKVNGLGHVSLNQTRRRAKGSARDAVARFKNDPNVRVFLLSLQHGAAGLTLVRANHVFMIDISLDPAIEQQAVARVHRIGQQRPVRVTRLLCHDTVEVAVLRSLEKKQQLWQEQQGGLGTGHLVEGEDEEDEQMELADDQVTLQGEEAGIPASATPRRISTVGSHVGMEGQQATPGTFLLAGTVPNSSQIAPDTPASRGGRSDNSRGRAGAGAAAEAPVLAVIAKREKMEASETLDLLNALG